MCNCVTISCSLLCGHIHETRETCQCEVENQRRDDASKHAAAFAETQVRSHLVEVVVDDKRRLLKFTTLTQDLLPRTAVLQVSSLDSLDGSIAAASHP